MKSRNWHRILTSIIATAPLLFAQGNLLTPERALSIALEHNRDLLIAANDTLIASVKNSYGEAGMLPKAYLTASEGISTTRPVIGDADPQSTRASATSLSIKGAIEWTFFDGGKAGARKQILATERTLSGLRYKSEALELAGNVLAAYYDIVRLKLSVNFTGELLDYAHNKLALAKISNEAGFTAKSPYLQAQMDRNIQQGKALEQNVRLGEATRKLNLLLGNPPSTGFEVIDSISLDSLPDLSSLTLHADSTSTALAMLSAQIAIITSKLRENSAKRLPDLSIGAGYQISDNDRLSPSRPDQSSRGPVAAVSLNLPLYLGGATVRTTTALSRAKESLDIAAMREKDLLYTRITDLDAEFRFQRELLTLEKGNTLLAKENLDIAVQRAALGEATMLELQEAEERYERARMNAINIAYACKIAATKVRVLAALF